jgi:hypothetical protein
MLRQLELQVSLVIDQPAIVLNQHVLIRLLHHHLHHASLRLLRVLREVRLYLPVDVLDVSDRVTQGLVPLTSSRLMLQRNVDLLVEVGELNVEVPIVLEPEVLRQSNIVDALQRNQVANLCVVWYLGLNGASCSVL